MTLQENFIKHLKSYYLSFWNYSKKTQMKETFKTHVNEAIITLLPKPDKDTT